MKTVGRKYKGGVMKVRRACVDKSKGEEEGEAEGKGG